MQVKTKLILNRWDAHGRSVHVMAVFLDGTQKELAYISQDTSLNDGSPRAPTVNWYAVGAVPPSYALAMSAVLERAAEVATEMERCEDWKRITPPAEGLRWNGPGMPEVHIKDGRAWVDQDGWVTEEGYHHAEG